MSQSLLEFVQRTGSSNEVIAVFLAAIFSVMGWIALRLMRARIGWGVSHRHAFNLHTLNPPVVAYTQQVWVQNIGREIAEGIEIIFAVRPAHFDLWPLRHFTELVNPDGTFVIRLDNLNPTEHVAVSIFQTAVAPPDVTNVRFAGGIGKKVPMGPAQQFSRQTKVILRFLLALGFFAFWYFLFRLLRWA